MRSWMVPWAMLPPPSTTIRTGSEACSRRNRGGSEPISLNLAEIEHSFEVEDPVGHWDDLQPESSYAQPHSNGGEDLG
jgi:hypothetical protein